MAGSGAALILFIVGAMFTFIGLILGSLCLFGGGLLCSGTLIGEMSSYFLLPGLALIGIGIVVSVLVGRHRKLHPPPPPPAVPFRSLRVELATEEAAPKVPVARVASKCPSCGGPVGREDDMCEWCHTPLL